MWWLIISNMVSWLRSSSDIDTVADDNIKPGIPENEDIPEYPAIRVCRGGERGVYLLTKGKSEATVYVYCWEGSDSQDPGDAYELLAALENKVATALESWLLQVQTALKIRISLEIPEIIPDGDIYRPAVGSRITLKLTWNK